MWHLEIWLRSDYGCAGLMVELDGIAGLFQP